MRLRPATRHGLPIRTCWRDDRVLSRRAEERGKVLGWNALPHHPFHRRPFVIEHVKRCHDRPRRISHEAAMPEIFGDLLARHQSKVQPPHVEIEPMKGVLGDLDWWSRAPEWLVVRHDPHDHRHVLRKRCLRPQKLPQLLSVIAKTEPGTARPVIRMPLPEDSQAKMRKARAIYPGDMVAGIAPHVVTRKIRRRLHQLPKLEAFALPPEAWHGPILPGFVEDLFAVPAEAKLVDLLRGLQHSRAGDEDGVGIGKLLRAESFVYPFREVVAVLQLHSVPRTEGTMSYRHNLFSLTTQQPL